MISLKRVSALLGIFMAFAGIGTQAQESNAQGQQVTLKADTVVATVDGQPITGQQIIESVNALPPQLRQQASNLYPQLLQRAVSLKIIAQKARTDNIANDPQYKKLMAKYEEEALKEVFLAKYVNKNVTEQMVKARYDENAKSNPPQDEIRASHILVKTEKEAKDVLGQLKKGEDFAKIAETKSTDKATSVRGGDLGYFTASGVVKEFSNAAFAMKIGEVSSAPVKSQFGWHVIKIVDRRKQTPPTYEQQKDQIRAALAEEQVQKLVAELRKSAKVELFNADGSPAQAPAQ